MQTASHAERGNILLRRATKIVILFKPLSTSQEGECSGNAVDFSSGSSQTWFESRPDYRLRFFGILFSLGGLMP